jgi:hypothetical protein
MCPYFYHVDWSHVGREPVARNSSQAFDQSVKHIGSPLLHNRRNVVVGAQEYVTWEISPEEEDKLSMTKTASLRDTSCTFASQADGRLCSMTRFQCMLLMFSLAERSGKLDANVSIAGLSKLRIDKIRERPSGPHHRYLYRSYQCRSL